LEKPFLSVVIPAYNEEQRLPETLEQVFVFLQTQSYTFEVLVVENGSRDRTLRLQDYARQYSQRVLSEPIRERKALCALHAGS
jgi:glycosyltransferase involved in cell wall biosynthesis